MTEALSAGRPHPDGPPQHPADPVRRRTSASSAYPSSTVAVSQTRERTGNARAESIPRTEPSRPIPRRGPADRVQQRIGGRGAQRRPARAGRRPEPCRPAAGAGAPARAAGRATKVTPSSAGPEPERAPPPAGVAGELERPGPLGPAWNGPVPAAGRLVRKRGASPLCGIERPRRDDPEPRRGEAARRRSGTGASSRKRTSSGRGASTANRCGSSLRPAGSVCQRREFASTAAALNGVPSWKRTFGPQGHRPDGPVARGLAPSRARPGLRRGLAVGPGEPLDQRLVDLAGDGLLGARPVRRERIERRGQARERVSERAAAARRRAARC